MVKPNKTFVLTVNDVEHIEDALRLLMSVADEDKVKEINKVLAKIHHQKVWYRPKENYVSG